MDELNKATKMDDKQIRSEQFLCRCHYCKVTTTVLVHRRISTMAWDCPKCHQATLLWPWLEKPRPHNVPLETEARLGVPVSVARPMRGYAGAGP
jgi:hypothetical protein